MKTIKLFAVTLLCATTLAAASVTMATQKKGNSGVASCCNMKHCCYGNKKCCKKADHACCTGAHAKGTCCCKKGSCPMPARTART